MQVLPGPGFPPSSLLSLGAYSYPAQPEVTPDAVFEDWVAPIQTRLVKQRCQLDTRWQQPPTGRLSLSLGRPPPLTQHNFKRLQEKDQPPNDWETL